MQNEQSEAIRNALSRAIKNASDSSLKSAVERLESGVTGGNDATQFPPNGEPFVRSTW